MNFKKWIILSVVLVAATAIGAGVIEKIQSDQVQMGIASSADDKELIFDVGDGGTNPKIVVDTTNKDFDLSKPLNVTGAITGTGNLTLDGNTLQYGDGGATDKLLIFDNGGTPPLIKWDNATSRLRFTNDGTNFKDLGLGGGGSGGINLLAEKNFDFEAGVTAWTSSGGTFAIESTNPLFGLGSGKWDSSGASQTLSSELILIEEGMAGGRCAVVVNYRWPSGISGDISVQVHDGTNVLVDLPLTPSTGTGAARAIQWFDCGAITESRRFRLFSNVADPAEITIDNVLLASDSNLVTEKPQDIFSATVANNGTVSSENLNWISGNCTNATPMVCTFDTSVFNQAPNCTVTAKDSTTTVSCQTEVSGSAASVRCSDSAGSNYTQITSKTLSCQKVESSANREALTLETTGSNWSGYHDNTCSWSRTNTAYGDPAVDASCALVERENSGFGSVTSYESGGDALPGIVFTPKITGKYYVCATPRYRATGASEQIGFKLWDGSSTIVEGKEFQFSVATSRTGPSLCGIYNVSSISPVTISIQTKIATGTIILEETASTTDAAIEWSIFPITQQFPAPIFTDIQNKMNAGEPNVKTCTAYIANAGSPTLTTETCSWIDSLVDNAVGDTTINITSGVFSVAPTCFCTSQRNTSTAGCYVDLTTAPSSALIRYQTIDGGGVANDHDFSIMCVGK